MTDSKQRILDAIRRGRPPEAAAPSLDQAWTVYDDPRQQFCEVLESVGGKARVVRDVAQLQAELQALPVYQEARKIASLVPGVGEPDVDLAALTSGHELADLDVAIAPGRFAVAENAAVWVTDQDVPQRAVFFICQHLVLVVPADQVVNNLHEAYVRLAGGSSDPGEGHAAFGQAGFGIFISGPSKTADIEQSLVIGAQGPRSLTVFLVESP